LKSIFLLFWKFLVILLDIFSLPLAAIISTRPLL
jgi:hypothetical protein